MISNEQYHSILTSLPKGTAHLHHWSLVKISGDKAQSFLQGQLTCDVTKVNEKQASLAALCNHQGRVLALMLLAQVAEDYFCLLPSSICHSFIQHINKYAVFSKVNVVDVTPDYAIYGRIAEASSAQPYAVLQSDGKSTLSLPGSLSIMWMDKSNTELLSLSEAEWNFAAILSKMPFILDSTVALATPHMLNLPELGAVSFDKGCYVGQEIVARTHYLGKSKKSLHLVQIESEYGILPGAPLTKVDDEVGRIINVCTQNQHTFALAVIQNTSIAEDLVCSGHSLKVI